MDLFGEIHDPARALAPPTQRPALHAHQGALRRDGSGFELGVAQNKPKEVRGHHDDGSTRHREISLKPSSNNPSPESIVLENLEGIELTIVAELVEVLS